jgi:predicted HTH transcriptional regulator
LWADIALFSFCKKGTGSERQSDIRNKIIAPAFKKIGIIDQWGNGLRLSADELKEYPEIEFRWFEKGLQFQVQFIKSDYAKQQELQQESMYSLVLKALREKALTTREISEALRQKEISGHLSRVIKKLLKDGLIERTIPDNPNHPAQRHRLAERGQLFLKLIS